MKKINVTFRAYIDKEIEVSDEIYEHLINRELTYNEYWDIDKKASDAPIVGNIDYADILSIFDSENDTPFYEY